MPGSKIFVPMIKSNNIFGQPYGTMTNNFMIGEFKHGPAGREFDTQNKNDRFTSQNQIMYEDQYKTTATKFKRPVSANYTTQIPGFSNKKHN